MCYALLIDNGSYTETVISGFAEIANIQLQETSQLVFIKISNVLSNLSDSDKYPI